MGITVQEALLLEELGDVKLVAGHEHVQRTIQWVTIVEVLEDINRLQEGELLLTTAYGLASHSLQRKQIIYELANRNLAALAVHTGFYLEEIPQDMIDAANEVQIPLLEIPVKYNFSTVTRAILEQIINRHLKMLEFSQDIHEKLTQIVLANRSFSSVTQVLQQLIGADVRIYDDIWQKVTESLICANSPLLSDDEIRTIYFCLKDQGKLEQLLIYKRRLEHSYQKGEQEIKLSFFPIIANNYIYGYIGISKIKESWTELDVLAAQHAATVCAIEFLKQAAIAETEIRLKGGFLEELLGDHPKNEAQFTERAKLLQIHLDLAHTVACFRIHFTYDYFDDVEMQQLRFKLYHTIEHVLTQSHRQFLLRFRHDCIVLLVETDKARGHLNCSELLEEINHHWRYYHPHLRLSIGVGNPTHQIASYPRSSWEAEVALNYGHLLHQTSPIVHYNDLGAYHLLFEMQDKGMDLEAFYKKTLGPLVKTGKKENNPLLSTLDIYLLYNMNMKEASETLYIHRHTLKYRLMQIEKKTGRNLSSPHDRLQLHLAVLAFKMLERPNPR